MKRRFHWLGLTVACLGLLLGGCGRKDSVAEHDQSESEEGEGGGVSFKEGRGLSLNPEVIQALGLRTAEAEERPLADNIRLIAQVFETGPRVLACATVPAAEAEHFEQHPFQGAKLVRIDRSTATATRLVDLIVALDRTDTPAIGEFVEVIFAAEPTTVLAVSSTALLDSAAGTFVYVVNGEYYLRTPVKTGARSSDYVEITDGLYAGDVVVTAPVEQLWLAELRLTKGGGHSH
jgi:multidrug efflux pump subunit AcrA (membrane-fusion protein)